MFSMQTVSAQVTIEIINDSGQADTNVFIKVPGKLWPGNTNTPITPANLFANIDINIPPNPTSIPLSTLPTNGQVVSPISGTTNTVYQFTADYITSGSIYFTYGQPFTFTNALQPSPPPGSFGNAYRYDYAELSINDDAAANNAMDITYVDKFGIPLQMEWFRGTNLVTGSYVYASTKTLVNRFITNGLGQAVFALDATDITPGWQYTGPNSYTNFARILAPQKVSGTTTSVSPYPSITNYLNSLVGSAHAFALNGDSPQAGYYYVGYQVSIDTNASGWGVTLIQTTNVPPFDSTIITGIQYTNTITFTITNTSASQYVYGAPVGVGFYSTNGVPVTSTNSPSYPVEVWMIGDVLSALNFGFWGGVYGADSKDWFSRVEFTAFPFGSARNPNDGFYNSYAALVYNAADPYTYAFSERITPSVLISPTNDDRVRITILPDDRLDSPVVLTPTGNEIKRNSIILNWSPVAGATGYQVNVLRPYGIPSTNLPPSAVSYTFTNLQSGTPYSFSVQATGTAHGNPIITPARTVSATTLGTNTPVNGSFLYVQGGFNVTDPYFQVGSVDFNGIKLFPPDFHTTNDLFAVWLANEGTNQVLITVYDITNKIIANDWLTFELAHPFMVTNGVVTTNTAISNVTYSGQQRPNNLPNVIISGGTSSSFVVSTVPPPPVSFGLTYSPTETRKYAPVVTTVPPTLSLKILSVTALPGGGIQFTFDIPTGTSYTIEASGNLTSWQTVSTGTGQAGGESYNAPAGTNAVQFYRIRL